MDGMLGQESRSSCCLWLTKDANALLARILLRIIKDDTTWLTSLAHHKLTATLQQTTNQQVSVGSQHLMLLQLMY